MKMRTKMTLIMFLIGLVTTSIVIISFLFLNRKHVIEDIKYTNNIETNFVQTSIEREIEELIRFSYSLSHNEVIKSTLISSNSDYEALDDNTRTSTINLLNQEWIDSSEDDPFVKTITNNEISQYISQNLGLFSSIVGEVFVTNTYGLTIAANNKITDIDQSDEYWWITSYQNGDGELFIDDRGYDNSTNSYTLGIAVPIYYQEQFIGIMKINYNLETIFQNAILQFDQLETDDFYITRSNGDILFNPHLEPLKDKIPAEIQPLLQIDTQYNDISDINNVPNYITIRQIEFQNLNNTFVFGSEDLNDPTQLDQNNTGWYIVYYQPTGIIIQSGFSVLLYLAIAGLVLIIATTTIGYFISDSLTKPINELTSYIESVSAGNLEKRTIKTSTDEVLRLSKSFSNMVNHLNETLISKKDLEEEIGKREILENKLKNLSNIDELTNLYNRRAFNDFILKYYEKAIRYKESLTILLIDIDDFKNINDVHGHLVGDRVLIELSQEISDSIRKSDILARWGGEEFILLLPNTPTRRAYELSERIRLLISTNDFKIKSNLTISIGVAKLEENDTLDSFLNKADKAMYQAKTSGKNRTIIYKEN